MKFQIQVLKYSHLYFLNVIFFRAFWKIPYTFNLIP